VIGLSSAQLRRHDPLEPAAYFVVDDDWYVVQLLTSVQAYLIAVYCVCLDILGKE